MKKLLVLSVLSLFLSQNSFAQQIKKPVVSGSFYPDSAKFLAEKIKRFLRWAELDKTDKGVLALISPHAGYDYSGSVAAYGYKLIKDRPIRTVIIIGPSHYEYFDGISIYPQGALQTPLGNVAVDVELAESLIQFHPKISFYEPAFLKEHSIEVEIPFLQIVLDEFKIVPIVTGKFCYENCRILSQALLEATQARQDILIIASTDMSHYHPYEEACKMDNLTIQELKKLDAQSLYNRLGSQELELCGQAAVVATVLYAQAQGAQELEVLKYANSGDICGEKEKVVGYFSAAIYAPLRQGYGGLSSEALAKEDGRAKGGAMLNEEQEILGEAQKKRLLEIARKTIDKYLTSGEKLHFKEEDPTLLKNMGAFVTIHKHGRLRGCIGNIIAQQPLYLTVRDMAIQAATADPRFPAVTPDELKDIEIEISVLSEPKQVEDLAEIKLGIHGVIVKKGYAQGVFLPQVAEETGWSKEEFLSNLCAHKAGLDPLAWKNDKSTELYSFSAQVFAEK